MKIKEKLARSQNWESIYFFREGIFAQVFGVSLYLAVTQTNLSIKVCSYRYKKLNNAQILRAGLPTKTLEKRLSDQLIKHDFGYELKGDWQIEPDVFERWYSAQFSLFSSIPNTQNSNPNSDELPQGTHPIWLTDKEYDFVKNWTDNKYPASTDTAFVRRINQKIASGSA